MEIAFNIFAYFVNLLLLLILLPCVIVSNIDKITFDIFFYYFGGKVAVYILLCLVVSIFIPTFVIAIFILILGYYLKKRK